MINELNKKVEIQEEIKIEDGLGGFNSSWETIKTIWCKIELMNVQLTDNYKSLAVEGTHIITTRKLNNIKSNMRLVFNNNIFLIKYIDDFDKDFIKIICLIKNF